MQDEIVSKTRRKQEMLDLQKIGVELIDLPEGQLRKIVLSQELLNAVLEARKIKSHGAKKRQMLYVGRLMRETDPAPIREQLDAINGSSARANAAHRRLEAWRAKLLADDDALTEFAAAFPDSDLQALRTLIRNTRKEQKEGKPPRSFRELFRLMKECSNSNPS
jgi:ribosome-associated protein